MTDKQLKTLVILFKTEKNLRKQIKISLENTGLTVNEFAALEALYNKGKISVNQLISYVLIPNSSMTYVIESLKKKGYIEQCPLEDDNRVKLISISERGQNIFTKAYDVHYTYMRQKFDVLSVEEEKTLQTLLKKLGRNLEGGQ